MEKFGLYFSKGMVPATSQGYGITDLNVAIPDPDKLLEEKGEILDRFIGVMMPILDIYQLSLAKMHIFYDLGAVTFNRKDSIFVNLRYYEKCRMCHFLPLCHFCSSWFK